MKYFRHEISAIYGNMAILTTLAKKCFAPNFFKQEFSHIRYMYSVSIHAGLCEVCSEVDCQLMAFPGSQKGTIQIMVSTSVGLEDTYIQCDYGSLVCRIWLPLYHQRQQLLRF